MSSAIVGYCLLIGRQTNLFALRIQVFGTPNETNWPDHNTLPLPSRGLTWDDTPAIPFDEIFEAATKDAISLLRSILTLDPNNRFSATEALRHPYFQNDPPPTPKKRLILKPP